MREDNMANWAAENNRRAVQALLDAKIWYGPGTPVWPTVQTLRGAKTRANRVVVAQPSRHFVVDPDNITPQVYIAAAAQVTGISMMDLLLKNRTPPVVSARRAAIITIWQHFASYGVSKIARLFDCDHSTISHALRKERSTQLNRDILAINALIKEKLNHV